MRLLPLLLLLPATLPAAGLELVRAVISQSDGGPAVSSSHEYVAGETLYFSCRVSGYAKSPENRVQLAYTVQAFDPKGTPVVEIYKGEYTGEVLPQDKTWMPKIEVGITLPPLLRSGAFRIVVNSEDLIAKTSTSLPVPFEVRGRQVDASDTLVARNFAFARAEEGAVAVNGVFRKGETLHARFDITGYRYGPGNAVDVSYVVSVLSAAGKVLWTQPEPAAERSASFYPKQWVQASMQLDLGTVKPGSYVMKVALKDAVGNQETEFTQPFTVE